MLSIPSVQQGNEKAFAHRPTQEFLHGYRDTRFETSWQQRLGASMACATTSTPKSGPRKMVESLLVALLADGHCWSKAARPGQDARHQSLAHGLECEFQRVQFTPDMLPADLTGSDIYRPEEGNFQFQRGRCFTTWCWPTKSTAPRPRCSPRCWRPWASTRSARHDHLCAAPLFLVMATQTPSSTKAPTRCRGAVGPFHAAHSGGLPGPRHHRRIMDLNPARGVGRAPD